MAMRILHTADWHMNDRLGRVDRAQDIVRALEQISRYLEEHHVDVMVVAGDIFSERSTAEQMRAAVGKIKDCYLPFLQRGGTILAISGNHDSEAFFETLRDALDLAAPGRVGANGTDATGRLYVAPLPRIVRLADPSGEVVQFVLMPYPRASNYLRGEAINYRTLEEKHSRIQAKFREVLQALQAKLQPELPAVLVSHIHVRGVRVNRIYRLSEAEDVIFEPSDVPTHWVYAAYGHIHCPQSALSGAEHVRYSGSIERMDASERQDEKSVALIDIVNKQLSHRPDLLPLASTPIHQVEITDPDGQLPALVAQYPDAQIALVDYTLHWQPGKHNRDALCQEVERIFPRWYSRSLQEVGHQLNTTSTFKPDKLRDVPGTVREYLTAQLERHPDREALLALAEQLLSTRG